MAPSSDGLRAASYLRTSGEGQRDNTSIPTQREDTDRLIAHNCWAFVRSYVDECKSGSKIAGRDAFQQMMKDAAKGDFDVVAVYEISRYGRNGADIIESVRTLKRDFGVDVVDAKGSFDTRDPSRTLMNFVGAGMAEQERLRILERTVRGRISKAKQGKPWSGHPPIGRAYDTKTGKWFVTELGHSIAEVLRRYAAGESMTALCNEIGALHRGKVSQWISDGQLSGIYSVRFSSCGIGIDTVVSIPEIPSIISDELLAKVKLRLRHNRTHNRVDVRKYLLSGFIRCRDCGKNLTAQTQHGTVYYRHKRLSGCTLAGVRGDQIERSALDFLYRFFVDEPAYQRAVMQANPSSDHRDNLAGQLSDTEKRIAKNELVTRRLVDAVADGVDIGILLSKQDELKNEAVSLRQRSRALASELASLPSPEAINQAAQYTRLLLMQKYQNRDWRSLAYDDVRGFLADLFGEDSKKSKAGILVQIDQRDRSIVTFEGNVEFDYRIVDGRPSSFLLEKETARLNEHIRESLRNGVTAAHEVVPNDLLKPFTDNSLSVRRRRKRIRKPVGLKEPSVHDERSSGAFRARTTSCPCHPTFASRPFASSPTFVR